MLNLFRCCAVLLCVPLALSAQSGDPQQLFQRAVAAQQSGDDLTAARIYEQLLEAHPEAIAVRVNLAATYAHQKRFDDAIGQYRAALAGDAGNLPVRVNLALAYEEKGRLKQAAQELEIAHHAKPGDPQAAILLGDCYNRLGRYADAVAVLMPIEASQPEDLDLAWQLGSALVHAGHPEEGLKRTDRVAKAASNADAYLLGAQTRLALMQYDLARRDADAAARLNPRLAGLQTLRGMILEQTGDYANAETALRKALSANPQDFGAHFYLGAILYFNRSMPEAQGELETALQLRPGSSQARYELALVLSAEDELDAAVKNLETVVGRSPTWIQPHIELSALYYKLHRPEDGARQREIVDRLTKENDGRSPGPMP